MGNWVMDPIPHCSNESEPKRSLTPAKKNVTHHLGDDVAVIIEAENANEFDETDEEINGGHPDENDADYLEELDYIDDERDQESDGEGRINQDSLGVQTPRMDDTENTVIEDEVFFNFKRRPCINNNDRVVGEESDSMEEIVE